MQNKLLTMKVPEYLKIRFSVLCKKNDTTTSREIREFMRRYVVAMEMENIDMEITEMK